MYLYYETHEGEKEVILITSEKLSTDNLDYTYIEDFCYDCSLGGKIFLDENNKPIVKKPPETPVTTKELEELRVETFLAISEMYEDFKGVDKYD